MSNKLTYNAVVLDKNFLKSSKTKYLKTIPVDLLIQINNEWLGSIMALRHNESAVVRHLNKARSKTLCKLTSVNDSVKQPRGK